MTSGWFGESYLRKSYELGECNYELYRNFPYITPNRTIAKQFPYNPPKKRVVPVVALFYELSTSENTIKMRSAIAPLDSGSEAIAATFQFLLYTRQY